MRIALGTAQFGLAYGISNKSGQVSFQESRAILNLAASFGIDTVDTAIAYGNSEQRLGELGVERWSVVTKLPTVPLNHENLTNWVSGTLSGSLLRLRQDQIYGLLLHRPEQLLEIGGERLYFALQHLKDRGVVKKIGCSVYDPAQLQAICTKFALDIVQAPFSIVDRQLLESGWMFRLRDMGVELHTRSAFLQGLLLMAGDQRPVVFSRWSTLWSLWHEWLTNTGQTPLQACLRYVLSFAEIDRVVLGVESVRQFEEIIAAASGTFVVPPAELMSRDPELINPAKWPPS